ncbi:MAG: hypothetical protein HFI75_07935 [Lachnospiraceae bacterium]|nr:hypothetical protein [Lachnospiraceae bacterium]
MLTNIKEYLLAVIKSRLFVLVLIFIALFGILVNRLFVLQIVNGEQYVNNFNLKIKKERVIPGTRGMIYDRNGNVLAYNELAYSVQIEDKGSYNTKKEKNEKLNPQLAHLIQIVEGHGDNLVDDFPIRLNAYGEMEYRVEGNALKRFLANVYGVSVEKLTKKQLNTDAATAFQTLASEKKYGISTEYDAALALKIMRIRYEMAVNNYQKYISMTVAEDVSSETVAIVLENANELEGVSIEETTIRKYVDSEYFAHIIGYTGKISTEELEELKKENEEYDGNDVIGKSGIEQYMETCLQGKKGSETLFVDSVGKVVETTDHKDAGTGDNIYLTIDMDLQKAVYEILEQKIAGILVSKIRNIKDYKPAPHAKADDIVIPIDDVYFALFNNNIIDIDRMSSETATETEKRVYAIFDNKRNSAVGAVADQLRQSSPQPYEALNEEMKNYMSYVASMLQEDKVMIKGRVDSENPVYQSWKSEKCSLREYLTEAIKQNWMDITKISSEGQYTSADETYEALVQYIEKRLQENKNFYKKLFEYLIEGNQISGQQVCLLLYEQGILAPDEGTMNALRSGSIGGYDFMLNKIKTMEITPAQLALAPCSGSCTVTDVNTGEVRALVTYPSYDNNRLANSVDAEYYSRLLNDLSKPLYNRATQERNAPGSTFKMVSSACGLTEGVISTSDRITDKVKFEAITPSPNCHSSSGHGSINVIQAIEHSCNYFFYETGYRLSLVNGVYTPDTGNAKLTKYAKMFGLGDKSGVEITESKPQIADEYPVVAAIGQSNHSFSCVQLGRYVTTVANSGNCYNLSLLDKRTDADGNLVEDYTPNLYTKVELADSTWSAIHEGMRAVVARTKSLKNNPVAIAGKTGTAQENELRPNHALFVGYAPYENPEIAFAVKITNGYTSANAAEVGGDIVTYYYKLPGYEQLLNGQALSASSESIAD